MKKIINGKLYDTETAKLISTESNGLGELNHDFIIESVYQKANGEQFKHVEGGANTIYSEVHYTYGNYETSAGELIIDEDKISLEEIRFDPNYGYDPLSWISNSLTIDEIQQSLTVVYKHQFANSSSRNGIETATFYKDGETYYMIIDKEYSDNVDAYRLNIHAFKRFLEVFGTVEEYVELFGQVSE